MTDDVARVASRPRQLVVAHVRRRERVPVVLRPRHHVRVLAGVTVVTGGAGQLPIAVVAHLHLLLGLAEPPARHVEVLPPLFLLAPHLREQLTEDGQRFDEVVVARLLGHLSLFALFLTQLRVQLLDLLQALVGHFAPPCRSRSSPIE